jgi:hypothetical protein
MFTHSQKRRKEKRVWDTFHRITTAQIPTQASPYTQLCSHFLFIPKTAYKLSLPTTLQFHLLKPLSPCPPLTKISKVLTIILFLFLLLSQGLFLQRNCEKKKHIFLLIFTTNASILYSHNTWSLIVKTWSLIVLNGRVDEKDCNF